jgi:predicted deacylase
MNGSLERIDLARFARGNCGVPFAFRFDSGIAGPVVTLLALTHGNEIAGAIVMAELLDQGIQPLQGRLNLVFANPLAHGGPGQPARRYVDCDLNRVWDPAVLDGPGQAWELQRARVLRPILESSDFLLDLHTTATDDPPFLISTAQPAARRLLDALPFPSHRVVFERPMHKGLLLIEACGFSDPASARVALVAECGHHDQPDSVDLARRVTGSFLAATGVARNASVDSADTTILRGQEFLARRMVLAKTDSFRFVRLFRSFEPLGADEVFAHDGGMEITAGFDGAVILMPRLKPVRDGEAGLLAQALRFP